MARLPRYAGLGQPQHVIQRGNNRTEVFAGPDDYLVFTECLLSAIRRFACPVHAYVFMTNHVHLLMSPHVGGAISKVMQSVGRRYVRYFNDRYGRSGTLWEGRYRATVISSDEYLFTCQRYIEENPVRAGMVSQSVEYRWSSYSANAFGSEDPLVTPHELYLALDTAPRGRQLAYRALFRDGIQPDALAEIRDGTNNAWALGERLRNGDVQTSRRAARLPRGRKPRIGV